MTDTGKILTEVKKLLGLDETYDAFDMDVVIHINSAFGTLHQLGVGPKEPFFITAEGNQTWAQFTQDRTLQSVKSYVFTSVRLIFDPPQDAHVRESMERLKTELEWRLNVAGDREPNENGG